MNYIDFDTLINFLAHTNAEICQRNGLSYKSLYITMEIASDPSQNSMQKYEIFKWPYLKNYLRYLHSVLSFGFLTSKYIIYVIFDGCMTCCRENRKCKIGEKFMFFINIFATARATVKMMTRTCSLWVVT